jgi:hypothetical protein
VRNDLSNAKPARSKDNKALCAHGQTLRQWNLIAGTSSGRVSGDFSHKKFIDQENRRLALYGHFIWHELFGAFENWISAKMKSKNRFSDFFAIDSSFFGANGSVFGVIVPLADFFEVSFCQIGNTAGMCCFSGVKTQYKVHDYLSYHQSEENPDILHYFEDISCLPCPLFLSRLYLR